MNTINASAWRRRVAMVAATGSLALGLVTTTTAQAQTQPAQPASGPGGSAYPYASVRVTPGGSGSNAYFVFEPMSPQPVSAPLVIMMHGYIEYSGYAQLSDFIMHTVRKGNVVIYPRYQTGFFTPCTGGFGWENCANAAVKGIKDGITYLQASSGRVQPQLDKTSYFGFSFGGFLTANLTNRWVAQGLPKPRVIFLDDPHDGMTDGAFDSNMSGIPSTVLLQCHNGSQGVIAEKPTASCNTFFPRLGHIPVSNKNLVMLYPDTHGPAGLDSKHGVSVAPPKDAYDWNFTWKTFDAMRSCAFSGVDCQYGMGDTAEHRSNGVWSDGVPVKPLKIQTSAPIAP